MRWRRRDRKLLLPRLLPVGFTEPLIRPDFADRLQIFRPLILSGRIHLHAHTLASKRDASGQHEATYQMVNRAFQQHSPTHVPRRRKGVNQRHGDCWVDCESEAGRSVKTYVAPNGSSIT